MSDADIERRLATILMADVVEYSRLMEVDEADTLRSLQEHLFALINPTIGQYQGRIVKLMGDGLLAEFPSVVDAVQCAISIQTGMTRRNENVPEERQIQFRIGMNLGDVLIDGDDIYGDGVNIAARLQALADPNGIMISHNVHSQVDGTIDHKFADAGAHQLKNISKVVRAYQFNPEAPSQSPTKSFRPFVDLPVEKEPLATGGCLCGQVRYEVDGKALGSMLCHCRMCQRYSGAPMLEGTTFPAEAFIVTKGKLQVYQSSEIAERSFCGSCGSPILYQGRIGYWTKWVVVTTGSFDDPAKFPPTYHLGIESQLPWARFLDELPKTKCYDSPSLVEAYRAVGKEVP
ncbi:MAG: GFA family protein [Rhizobiaceae bacterium]